MEVPGAGVVGVFAEGDGAGGGDEAVVVSEAPERAAGTAGIVETVEFEEIAAALFGDGKCVDDGVVAIGDQIAAELPDAGEVGVVKHHDAAGLQEGGRRRRSRREWNRKCASRR